MNRILNDQRLLKAIVLLDKHFPEYSSVVARLRSLSYDQQTKIAQLRAACENALAWIERLEAYQYSAQNEWGEQWPGASVPIRQEDMIKELKQVLGIKNG